MKVIGVATAVVVFLWTLLGNAQQTNRAKVDSVSDVNAIEQLERADAIAAKANDVELLTSLWADDGVLIQPLAPPIVGRTNIRALLDQQKSQGAGVKMVAYEEDWKERQIHGDRAFEWGTITATMRFPNGKEGTQVVYAARVLVRGDHNSWRFARVIITPAPRKPDTSATAQ